MSECVIQFILSVPHVWNSCSAFELHLRFPWNLEDDDSFTLSVHRVEQPRDRFPSVFNRKQTKNIA